MGISEILESIAANFELSVGASRLGKGLTFASLVGWFTTSNLVWLAGCVPPVAILLTQIWFDYKLRRTVTRLKAEAEKARQRKALQAEGIDTADIPLLQFSPDPDSEERP